MNSLNRGQSLGQRQGQRQILRLDQRQDRLRKSIRTQLMQMAVVMAGLAGLVVFAGHFIWTGIAANVYLNGTIIAVFLFGCMLSFRRVVLIRNDAIAFAALQEAFDDARKERTELISDPYWRHYRCMEQGIAFGSPKSIGHMFELAYEELLRAKNLNINVATLQNIVGGIEMRLSDER
ncbi:MAG: hypothetical protein ACRCWO_00420, partial [Bosea sp. (in: a-proteobacteria)]